MSIRQLLNAAPNGIYISDETSTFWRVCADEVDANGDEVGSVAFPGVCSEETARTQLDTLRCDPENARYNVWYIVKFSTLSAQQIVTDVPRVGPPCGRQNGKVQS